MTGLTLNDAASPRSTRIAGLTVVIALHFAGAILLLQLESVRSAVTAAVPITVRLLMPAKPPEPEILPKPLPVKPRMQKPRPVETPPITTVVTDAPTPFVAPPPPPVPAVVAPPETVVAAAPPAPPAPPLISVTPPIFNADYLNNPPPGYPALSRRMGEAGKVMLRIFVNEQGLPAQVQIRTSSGHARLDDAAMATVRLWRFVPARRGDTPVGAWVLVPIVFTLRS